MKYCLFCGALLETTVSEGDRYTWTTQRCTGRCGFVSTFADGGTLDIGLRVGTAPEEVTNFFHESPEPLPEGWKICVPVTCGAAEEEDET